MSNDDKCLAVVVSLLEKYKTNSYMLNRVHTHILNLPNTLEIEHKNYEKRVTRNSYLTNEQLTFIQVFLSKNQYYYLSNNNYFYEYDGVRYKIVRDDDIIHNLLSSISKERVLLDWKYKTKVNILKQIKDRNLFSSIPETDTIQNILSLLYPFAFTSKNQAKHFLTIIGDNILKKNSNLIFLVDASVKKMLLELDGIAQASIGVTNTTHNLMTKYHENHSYDNCRLLKTNDNFSNDVWKNILRNNGLDLLCVAAHYSNRYNSSDDFINNNSDEQLKNYVFYLKNTTQKDIIDQFTSKYIETTNIRIEWKNLHFVWKLFLSDMSLPNMIYSNALKLSLKDKFAYDEPSDSFLNITSKYLPVHSNFIQFWNNTVNINDVGGELEVDELCSLFKSWSKHTHDINQNISEEGVIKILKHFFPEVEIIEDKYVMNVNCILWEKNADITSSFEYIKEQIQQTHTLSLISFDELYNYYRKYCSSKLHKFIVSKRYFEKQIYLTLSEHVVYEKFLKTDWINFLEKS